MSVEHIIPESLGNTEHVLPRGVVCDVCNNYFARKIEGPVLETAYFRHKRSMMWVANKRGRVPAMSAVLPSLRMKADVWLNGPSLHIEPRDRDRQGELEQSLLERKGGRLFIPIPADPDQKLMSRLLGKIAIEALAQHLMKVEGWRAELLRVEGLRKLSRFVRVGDRPEKWEYSRRSIYSPDQLFGVGKDRYEILHEF